MALFAGRPSVLEAFYGLTGEGSLELRWNPLDDPSKWVFDGKPSDDAIKFPAAVRALCGSGYIESVTDGGVSNYTATASDEAEAVRKALDKLPDSLKGQVKAELERSRA